MSARRIATRDAGDAIAERRTFDTHGALSGRAFTHSGYAPMRGSDQRPDYVVFSYAAEIAWHVPGYGWTLDDTRYSVTTSRHQGIVRRALGVAA